MKSRYLILVCIGIVSCMPMAQSSFNSQGNPKILMLKDFAYESKIKTILLAPDSEPMAPAVTRLGEWNLMLQFDDLSTGRDTYYAKVVHCNFDWTKSSLQDLDFMASYNEFPVNNSEFSIDTHIQYVHYWLAVPPVKLPGNYVLFVYRENNKDDLILSKRFVVYETLLSFTNDGNLIGPGSIANINQQINFTVDYKNVNIVNPLLDVHVTIRQNQRWDNMAEDVRPSFVREIEKELEYRFFDESKMFRGGNEFRFFDLRSLNNPGRNVNYVAKTEKPYETFIAKDKSRAGESYSQYDDLNGAFIIENYDYRDLAFTNYTYVTFSLESPPVNGDVYVTGGFHYWNLNNENKMKYDSAKAMYTTRILMKQGWYDYQYLVRSPRLLPYYFEGSHFETENYYEIFVYNRPFQPQADLLIGYLRLQKNPR